jgi:hypothetical protein
MRWLLALLLLLVPTTALSADFRVTSCDCGKPVVIEADSLTPDAGGMTATVITFGEAGPDGVAPMSYTRARFDCSKGTMRRLSDRTLTRPSPQGFAALSQPGPDAGFDPEIILPGTAPDAAMAAVCPGQSTGKAAIVRAASVAEVYDYHAHAFQKTPSALPRDRLAAWAKAYRQAGIVPPPRWTEPAWFWPIRTLLAVGLMTAFGAGFAALARRFGRLPPDEVRYPLWISGTAPFFGLLAMGVLAYGWFDPEMPLSAILIVAGLFAAGSLGVSPLLLWWRFRLDDRGFTFTDYFRRTRRHAWSDVVHVYGREDSLVFILKGGRRLTLPLGAHNAERFVDKTAAAGVTALN